MSGAPFFAHVRATIHIAHVSATIESPCQGQAPQPGRIHCEIKGKHARSWRDVYGTSRLLHLIRTKGKATSCVGERAEDIAHRNRREPLMPNLAVPCAQCLVHCLISAHHPTVERQYEASPSTCVNSKASWGS
eukprot:2005945-Rhodomonas_salina.1